MLRMFGMSGGGAASGNTPTSPRDGLPSPVANSASGAPARPGATAPSGVESDSRPTGGVAGGGGGAGAVRGAPARAADGGDAPRRGCNPLCLSPALALRNDDVHFCRRGLHRAHAPCMEEVEVEGRVGGKGGMVKVPRTGFSFPVELLPPEGRGDATGRPPGSFSEICNGCIREIMQVLQSPSLGGGAASAAGSSRSGAGDGALSTPPPLHSSLVKCKVTRCPKYAPDRPMLTCDAAGCEKEVHDQCYIRIAEKSTTVQPLENHRFCTITCQKKYEHQADPALNWTNDGRNGPQDPHTSQFYLLQWLNNEDHYNTWRDPGDGITKKELAENIGRMIKGHGVQRELGGPVVKAKIETIFKSMKEAYDFENSDTGQGILEEIGEASFREKVRDVCSFYYDLKDVFVSRAGVRPKETTATLYNNSSFTDSDDTDSSEESTSTGSEESGAPQGSAAAETEMGDVALSASNASDMAGGDGVGAVEADEAMPYVCDAAEHGDEVAKLMRDKCRPMVEKIERARDQFSGPALGPLAWYIAVDEENESAANSALNSWGDEILLRCVVTNANDVHVMHSLGLPRPRRVELLPAKSATERAKILPEEGSDEETLVQMDLKNTLAFNAFANLLQKKEDGLLEDHADDQSVASTDKSLGAGAATGEERDGGADAEAEKAKKKKTKKKKKKKGKRRQSPSADEQSAKKKGRPRRKASPNKQKRKRAPRNGSAPGGGDTPKFDNLLGQLLEQKVRQNESKAGESTARLAKSFAEAAEVLGKNGEIKAAYANEAFEQFLDGDQLIELAKHKKAIKKARKSR